MALTCDIKNPLKRDGTSQEKREIAALKPENVSIDDRTAEDLKAFALGFAEQVQFYDADNNLLGDWTTFFDEDLDQDAPHLALFNTFLELFAYAQDHINELTAEHLDFYYQDVLQMQKKSAEPDQAHILFELAKNVATHIVDEDTELSAGKDDTNVELIYTTNKEIVVNVAAVESFKTVYLQQSGSDLEMVFAASAANSADGAGEEFESEDDNWAPFGEEQGGDAAITTMAEADLGFAIASPALLLREGKRFVFLTIEIEGELIYSDYLHLAGALKCAFTGEEGWVEASSFSIFSEVHDEIEEDSDEEEGIGIIEAETIDLSAPVTTLQFKATLNAEDDAVVPYDDAVFEENFDTLYPMVRLLCDPEASSYAYALLQSLTVESIGINVAVHGAQDLALQSGAALLDPSAPFLPFGPLAPIKSALYIGSDEIFRKKLDKLSLEIEWHDLPQSDLGAHYENYAPLEEDDEGDMVRSGSVANSDFKATVSLLRKREWKTVGEEQQLFRSDAEDIRHITFTEFDNDIDDDEYDRSLNSGDTNEWTTATRDGFLRLELTAPTSPFRAFGHKAYPRILTKNTIAAATLGTEEARDEIPEPPYTPTIKSLGLYYTSGVSIDFSADGLDAVIQSEYEERVEQFFHISPFGHEEQHPYLSRLRSETGDVILVPQFTGEGTLYIGLSDLEAGQNISLLFQVAEGTADPEASKETIAWSYLTETGWTGFGTDEVLSDGTNQLLTSGIITFATSSSLSDSNPLLPLGMHWIRGVTQNAEAHARVIDVHAQAVTVTFSDNGNSSTHLADALEAETISKLAVAQSEIKSVTQPYASFGGRTEEEDEDYYVRVSERLRHKKRAITIWDYEHLVLQEFPSVYKVKCINHTDRTSEFAPGKVSLVIVSNLRNQNAVNPLEPTTSVNTLDEIQTYVDAISTTFVTPIVRNPEFEKVRVNFHVRFHDDVDKGTYEAKIKEDINKFLSPWAYDEGEDIVFQGKIHRSMIINFVEELDYVDYVTCFRMDHVISDPDEIRCDVEQAQASQAAAILVADSEENHVVVTMETDDCACEGAASVSAGSEPDAGEDLEGIGYWAVGEDFEVS